MRIRLDDRASMNLQKLVWPTVQLIIENSRAAPSPKKIGRKRYTPNVFLPGQLSRNRCRTLVGCFMDVWKAQEGVRFDLNYDLVGNEISEVM